MSMDPAGAQICSQADIKQEEKPSLAGTCFLMWMFMVLACLFYLISQISFPFETNAGGMISVAAEFPLLNQR